MTKEVLVGIALKDTIGGQHTPDPGWISFS